MNTNMILSRLSTKTNGAFIKVTYTSDIPVKAAYKKAGVTAYKETTMTVRKGIRYTAQKAVMEKQFEKLANGTATDISTSTPLSWGQWKKGYEGLVIEHKGVDYIRFYSSPNKAKSIYYLNGKEMTLEELKNSGMILDSFFNKSTEKPLAMTIKAENIQKIW